MAADTVLDRVSAPSPVSALRGWVAYAQTDAATGTVRLAVRPPAGPSRRPAIAPLRDAFSSFDLGTDRRGRLVVALSRCPTNATCRLSMLSLATGIEQQIRSVPAGALRAPTVWRGRLAWAQGLSGSTPTVRTRLLSWPSSRASVRLPGAPRTITGEVSGKPLAVKGANVFTLDLGAHGLAEGIYYDNPEAGICGNTQVRYVALPRVGSRVLRTTICGLAGAQITGPSLSGDRIGWQISCPGDDSGCLGRTGGAFRTDLRSGLTEQRKTPGRYFNGFALDGDAAYALEVFDEQSCGRYSTTTNVLTPVGCPVERLSPVGWVPLPARRP